jgi:hypothetical protein
VTFDLNGNIYRTPNASNRIGTVPGRLARLTIIDGFWEDNLGGLLAISANGSGTLVVSTGGSFFGETQVRDTQKLDAQNSQVKSKRMGSSMMRNWWLGASGLGHSKPVSIPLFRKSIPRIDERQPHSSEVFLIARCQSGTAHSTDRCNLRIRHGDTCPRAFAPGDQRRVSHRRCKIKRQDPACEILLQHCRYRLRELLLAATLGQSSHTEHQLCRNY